VAAAVVVLHTIAELGIVVLVEPGLTFASSASSSPPLTSWF
jgi:hypothetical protein